MHNNNSSHRLQFSSRTDSEEVPALIPLALIVPEMNVFLQNYNIRSCIYLIKTKHKQSKIMSGK